jgi:hypothetical protein
LSPRLLIPAALLAVLASASGGGARVVATHDCSPGADWGAARQNLVPTVLKLVNAHRSALGLSQLRLSPTLTASAVWKARHMARFGYVAHDDPAPPVSRSADQRMVDCGYPWSWTGENIAAGFRTPEGVMAAWLQSPGHRANLEAPEWNVIGLGVAQSGPGALFWAQDFGAHDDSSADRAPLARADHRIVRRNHQVRIHVLLNDRDPDGDQLALVRVTTRPRHGRAWLAAEGTVVYRPWRGFIGRDRLRYEVADGRGGHDSAVVRLRVKPLRRSR